MEILEFCGVCLTSSICATVVLDMLTNSKKESKKGVRKMFIVVSNYSIPIPASSLYEAQMILGREYNLKLAEILMECDIANPIRNKTDNNAFVIWKGKKYEWHIEENEESAA